MGIIENILKEARKKKMLELDFQLREELNSREVGEMFPCPICKYTNERGKGSAKVFPNRTFKCFSCGVWRSLG